MKLHLPHLLRNALLAALLCCTMAFGTVTVTVGDQPSSLQELTEAPEGSVSITVRGEDAILDHDLTLDGSADHYITVEEGHSLTIKGSLTYHCDYSSDPVQHPSSRLHLLNGDGSLTGSGEQGGKIIFAVGESELGSVAGGSGEIVVQAGAKVTVSDDSYSYLLGSLTIEKGGLVTVADMGCTALNGSGTLSLRKNLKDGYSIFSIYGKAGNFSGMIEGEQFVEIDGGPATVDPKKIKQIFTDVSAKGTKLSVFIGELVLAGEKNEFKGPITTFPATIP